MSKLYAETGDCHFKVDGVFASNNQILTVPDKDDPTNVCFQINANSAMPFADSKSVAAGKRDNSKI